MKLLKIHVVSSDNVNKSQTFVPRQVKHIKFKVGSRMRLKIDDKGWCESSWFNEKDSKMMTKFAEKIGFHTLEKNNSSRASSFNSLLSLFSSVICSTVQWRRTSHRKVIKHVCFFATFNCVRKRFIENFLRQQDSMRWESLWRIMWLFFIESETAKT